MDHVVYLRSLSSDEKRRLTRRCDAAGLVHLAGHAGPIVVFGALIAVGIPFWWLLLVPQGILLAFLFTLQHETTHKTPFASEPLNEWAGRITGLLLFQPFLWFRYFHLAHHRHTNDPANDPELTVPKPDTWTQFALYLSTLGYWRSKAKVLWTNALEKNDEDYLATSARPRIVKEARIMLGFYVLFLGMTLFVSPILLWVWLIPLALGFPFLRLYLLAEHGQCPAVANMFLNTRTTFTTRLVRFIAWNMPYHTEHHTYPQVPFHQLPAFHSMIRDRLKQTSNGYVEFTQDYVSAFQPANKQN